MRARFMENWMEASDWVVVATIAFGMGIDKRKALHLRAIYFLRESPDSREMFYSMSDICLTYVCQICHLTENNL